MLMTLVSKWSFKEEEVKAHKLDLLCRTALYFQVLKFIQERNKDDFTSEKAKQSEWRFRSIMTTRPPYPCMLLTLYISLAHFKDPAIGVRPIIRQV